MGALATIASNVRSYLGQFAPSGLPFTPPASWPVSWWQQGYRMPKQGGNAAIEACVGAISQVVASLPIAHFRIASNGANEPIKNSYITKVLRNPNSYQTRADFFINLLRNELLSGNGVALATRDQAGSINSLHIAPHYAGTPYVNKETGDIFYNISPHDLTPEGPLTNDYDTRYLWPARDVLHIRMHTPHHPLIGETPIKAAMASVMAANAITGHFATFFSNMARPSGFITAPKILRKEVMEKFKEQWEESYSKAGSGKTAVLMDGMEWKPMTMTSVDAEIIEAYKMTIADVARVYRVPLSIVGEMGGATYNNTSVLISTWLSTGLGYTLEHVELALDVLFGLPENEFIAFDVDYLLRTDFISRVEGLTKAITGGLISPNEARLKEGLPPVKAGDEPRLQAQVVPLSVANQIPSAASSPAPSAPMKPPSKAKSPQEYLARLKKVA